MLVDYMSPNNTLHSPQSDQSPTPGQNQYKFQYKCLGCTPGLRLDSDWTLTGLCVELRQTLIRLCTVSVWTLIGPYTKFVLTLHQPCTGPIWTPLGLQSDSVLNLFQPCINTAQNLYRLQFNVESIQVLYKT